VEGLLVAQDPDGYLGVYPPGQRWQWHLPNGELWCQSRIMCALLAFHSATGRTDVIAATEALASCVTENYPAGGGAFDSRGERWNGGRTHGLMIIEPMLELAALTGRRELIEFAVRAYEDFSAEDVGISYEDCGLRLLMDPSRPFVGHGAHTAEHVRIPGLLHRATGEPRYMEGLRAALRKLGDCACVTGAPKSDEYIGSKSGPPVPLPGSGFEYCATVEAMLSYEVSTLVTGEMSFADAAEDVMLNAGQAARRWDGKSIAYLAAANQLRADAGYGLRWKYSPVHEDVAVCCAPNAGRMLPYFVSRMIATDYAASEIAMLAYGASVARAQLATGEVSIRQTTSYPFLDDIDIEIGVQRQVEFGLGLRIPAWTDGATLAVNGVDQPVPPVADGYTAVRRLWSHGDRVQLRLKPRISPVDLKDHSVAIRRGPLLFTIPIEEVAMDRVTYQEAGFADTDYRPAESAFWGYSLRRRAELSDLGCTLRRAPVGPNPWADSPLRLLAPMHDPRSDETEQACGAVEVEMIPIGATTLRLTGMPWLEDSSIGG
jgi:DUF1680 family protein